MAAAGCLLYHLVLMDMTLPHTNGLTANVPTTDASSRRTCGMTVPSMRAAAPFPVP
jgi:hypothetical protein